jgi:hypothetical protein
MLSSLWFAHRKQMRQKMLFAPCVRLSSAT